MRRRKRGDAVRPIIRFILFPLAFLAACGVPTTDPDSDAGRDAIIVAVNKALTAGDCATAINLIEPLYNSKYTNNNVRMLRATAHACNAGIDYFPFIDALGSSNLAAGEFWVSMAKLFPYTDDSGLESGWNAEDATMAVIADTAVPASTNQFNVGTYNVGSELSADRTNDANLFLIFNAMAVIGRTENRNGAPDANFHKTKNFVWTTSAAMTTEGCAYAGAIVNMIDGASAIVNYTSGNLKTDLQEVTTGLQTVVGLACEQGCQACGFAAGACTATGSYCPAELRYRGNCQTANTSKATCAAIGIITAVNSDPIISWP